MTYRFPPLDHLRAFEVAARHLSFKKAANELNVTPAAIGQRIRALEDHLQVRLFKRLSRAIVLTEQGQLLAQEVRQGLDTIAHALTRLQGVDVDKANTITVSTTTTFAERWLLPKLPEFNDLYPDCSVKVYAMNEQTDFSGDADLAIRYGRGTYLGCHSLSLMDDYCVPVCTPELLSGETPINSPDDLQYNTLIYCDWTVEQAAEPNWPRWFQAHGLNPVEAKRELHFSVESLTIHAALNSQGISLNHIAYVNSDLNSGKLVMPFGPDKVLKPIFRYHLVWPEQVTLSNYAEQFKQWLIAKFETSI